MEPGEGPLRVVVQFRSATLQWPLRPGDGLRIIWRDEVLGVLPAEVFLDWLRVHLQSVAMMDKLARHLDPPHLPILDPWPETSDKPAYVALPPTKPPAPVRLRGVSKGRRLRGYRERS